MRLGLSEYSGFESGWPKSLGDLLPIYGPPVTAHARAKVFVELTLLEGLPNRMEENRCAKSLVLVV